MIAANRLVYEAVQALRRATADHERVWRGRELASLPAAVQTAIYNQSRAMRMKSNGAARATTRRAPGTAFMIRGRRG